jgi:hypothetical protein
MAVPTLPQTILYCTNHVLSDSFRLPLCNCSKRRGLWSSTVLSHQQPKQVPISKILKQQQQQQSNASIPFGLRSVDYAEMIKHGTPPVRWPLPPPPPPRRHQSLVRRFLPQLVALSGFTLFVFVLLNRDDENMYEYWKQVEQGHVPMDEVDIEDDEENDKRGA